MTKLFHPLTTDDFSVTIVDNSEIDCDDILVIHHEDSISIFSSSCSQYEYATIRLEGTFSKFPLEKYNEFCNGVITPSEFLAIVRNIKEK